MKEHDGSAQFNAQRAAESRAIHQLLDTRFRRSARRRDCRGESAVDELACCRCATVALSWLARSRYAGDELSAAIARGAMQYVILGAGLDTYAYRNQNSNLRVFEVDHPATQAWKRARLDAAGIAIPPSLAFVPAAFEEQRLRRHSRARDFKPAKSASFPGSARPPIRARKPHWKRWLLSDRCPPEVASCSTTLSAELLIRPLAEETAMDALASRFGRRMTQIATNVR